MSSFAWSPPSFIDIVEKALKSKDANVQAFASELDLAFRNLSQTINLIGNTTGVSVNNSGASVSSSIALNEVTSLLLDQVAAPGTPAANKTILWADATGKNPHAKDDSGVVTVMLQPKVASAGVFLTGINSNGSTTTASGITGSGTTNVLAKFTATGAIGVSSITDDGTGISTTESNLTIGSTLDTTVGVAIYGGSYTGTAQAALALAPTFTTAATAASYGVNIANFGANGAYVTTSVIGINISDFTLGTGQTATNDIGLLIGNIVAGGTTNRAIKTGAGQVELGDNIIWTTDNTHDIGASGATRPRTLYLGTSLDVGGTRAVIGSGGTVTTYNGISTTGAGVPAIYATAINLTGQGAAIGATTILAVGTAPGAGLYRISWYASVTTVGSLSSTLGPFAINFTDGAVVKTLPTTNLTGDNQDSTNTTATAIGGCFTCKVDASTNIQYTMGYTSNLGGTMKYDLSIKLEYLGV